MSLEEVAKLLATQDTTAPRFVAQQAAPISNNGHIEPAAQHPIDISVPERTTFIVRRSVLSIIDIVEAASAQGRRMNVLIKGRQGCGKSELVKQIAARSNRPLATIDVGRLAAADQLIGFMDLDAVTRRPIFRPGIFVKALQTPRCVVHLEELNRPESDKAHNAIFPLLDDTQRRIWIDELGDFIEVAPGVTVCATFNEGFEFIGTTPLDLALKDRFHIKIALDYLDADAEANILVIRTGCDHATATALVSVASDLRGNHKEPIDVSTRSLIVAAELCRFGLGVIDALKATIGADNEVLEAVLLSRHMAGQDAVASAEDTFTTL